MGLWGNHVVIDHGDGEFSRLGHYKSGSVMVQKGQRVQAGDTLDFPQSGSFAWHEARSNDGLAR